MQGLYTQDQVGQLLGLLEPSRGGGGENATRATSTMPVWPAAVAGANQQYGVQPAAYQKYQQLYQQNMQGMSHHQQQHLQKAILGQLDQFQGEPSRGGGGENATSRMPPPAAAGANWNNQQHGVPPATYQQAMNHQQQQHLHQQQQHLWTAVPEPTTYHQSPSQEEEEQIPTGGDSSPNYSPSQSPPPLPPQTPTDIIRVDSILLAALAVSIWPACVSKPESTTSTTYIVRPGSIPDEILEQLSSAKV